MQVLLKIGAAKKNIHLVDSKGLVTDSRDNLNVYKQVFAQTGNAGSTMADAIANADILIGLAGADIITPSMLESMQTRPIIFTLSNPEPEIPYALAKTTRPDAIIATGRSDLPNQINNVLCFPYIFKAALTQRAPAITFDMMYAAAKAISQIAREPSHDMDIPDFGPEYIIPKPFDPRLKTLVSKAVADAVV